MRRGDVRHTHTHTHTHIRDCTHVASDVAVSASSMGFTNLDQPAGLAQLDAYLLTRSYIEKYDASRARVHASAPASTDGGRCASHVPSQADVAVYQAVGAQPDAAKYSNAARWYRHIVSYASEHATLPGEKRPAHTYGPAVGAAEPQTAAKPSGDAAAPAAGKDDDDIDLFGEEESEESTRIREERLKEYEAKKAKKPALVAKSNIILDVKPWDDETDMAELERHVRAIQTDGLVWGSSKLVPVGYGIKKLQITCVVEDDKVGTDYLEEQITAITDLVQSMDVVAFNKI